MCEIEPTSGVLSSSSIAAMFFANEQDEGWTDGVDVVNVTAMTSPRIVIDLMRVLSPSLYEICAINTVLTVREDF